MKKFVAMLLALVLGLFSATVSTADTVTVDRPTEAKYVEWALGYNKRCRKYNGKIQPRNWTPVKRFVRRVALAPLCLFIGVAGAEGVQETKKEFIVSYMGTLNGKKQLFQMRTADSAKAKGAYEGVAKQGHPSAIHYTEGKGTILCAAANGWRINDERGVAVAPLTAISDAFVEKTRVVLNENYGPKDDRMFVVDTVRKPKTTVDEIVEFMGAKTILIECHIPEWEMAGSGDLSAQAIAEAKQEAWDEACDHGFKLDGVLYRVLGHGTNSGKLGHVIMCDSDHREAVFEVLKKVDSEWQTTAAKGTAYLTGLQNVRPKVWVDLPIKPEDFVFFKEIEEDSPTNRADMINGNVFKKALLEGGRTNPYSKADGQVLVHVSAKKRQEWIDDAISNGMGRREARRHVDDQIAMLMNSFSARTRNAALKFSAIWFDFHSIWRKETGCETIHGRNLDDVVFVGDDSVRKTKVGGKGAAFHSEEEWADAVRFDKTTGHKFQLGLLITEEHFKVKDLPYQFLQLLYGASDEAINKLAKKIVGKIRELHTLDGLGKHLPKELKILLKFLPSAGRHPVIRERIENAFYKQIDKIMSGKYLEAGSYGMMHGDPVYQIQSYMVQDGHDVEVVGCLEAGTICLIGKTTEENQGKEGVAYRSPIATLGALKRMTTSIIAPEYQEYFNGTGPCLLFNVKDDAVTQLAGDYDGDHAGWTEDEDIYTAVTEAQIARGTWLPISDPGSPEKGLFTVEAFEQYCKGLTLISPLGQTMIEQHKILNGIKTIWKNGIPVGRETFVPSADAVLSEGDHALNQVDASKHGNTTGKKHADCKRQGKYGELAKSKIYRDTIKHSNGPVDRATLRAIKPEPEELCVGVLNKMYRYIYFAADLEFGLYDLPEINGEWDETVCNSVLEKLMFDATNKKFRGISALFRKGTYDKTLGFSPDEGLFQSLSRRSWKVWTLVCGSGDGDRRMSKKDFTEAVRKQGLAEIRTFAEAWDKNIEDAYDIVIWQMFAYSMKYYGNSDRKIDGILLSDLWNATFDIFGGMMAERASGNSEFDIENEFDLSIDEFDIDDDDDDED